MNDKPNKTLTVIEAARLIFRTASPREAQVQQVQKLIKAGMLKESVCDGPPLRWTTTTTAVADYLATESLERQKARHPAQAAGNPYLASPASTPMGTLTCQSPDAARLESAYHDIWRDYFLSVFLRRKSAHRSKNFQRAVLAGQTGLLLTLILLMVGGIHLTREDVPPQREPVEEWIDENTDHYTILRWYPPEPADALSGVILRVEYSYQKDSPRRIITDRKFLVQGEHAREYSDD